MSTSSDPDNLDPLALRAGADIRSPLLYTLVDLYVQKPSHTEEEAQHSTELMLRLLDQADIEAHVAIARRLASYPSVPPAIVRQLSEHLSKNAPRDRLQHRGGEPGCGAAPAMQTHASPAELSDLFFAASSAERRLILINLTYLPTPSESLNAGQAAHQLETAALAHNADAFLRALERSLVITPAIARRIMHDARGEPLVVVAKALDIAADALQRILLFVNPVVGRSVSRVYELAALFEAIDRQSACTLVAIWRAAARAGSARPAQSVDAKRTPRREGATQSSPPGRELEASASRSIRKWR
jgi:hypothetical protein